MSRKIYDLRFVICDLKTKTGRFQYQLRPNSDKGFMLIGVPKEVKDHESRVGIVPSGVKVLVDAGHKVIVETNAGGLSSMPDSDYKAAGAETLGAGPKLLGVWCLHINYKP